MKFKQKQNDVLIKTAKLLSKRLLYGGNVRLFITSKI